ncbi:MAG: Rieske (2Fe-2S) protein [Candidatus Rokubacteria bacterium]|nr:Rieske (2Fe-2S) protein [Candidatus Rokubacteria bacterium]
MARARAEHRAAPRREAIPGSQHAATEAPTDAADDGAPALPRRRFLTRLTVACGAAVAGLLGLPAGAILVWPPGRQTGTAWRAVGEVSTFAPGATTKVTYFDANPLPWAGFAAETAAWLRREPNGEFVAFTIYCTHTGCPVRWEEQAQLFMCPCHGGAFHRDGAVAAGPPPTPLTRYGVRVTDGVVEIQPTPLPRQTRG